MKRKKKQYHPPDNLNISKYDCIKLTHKDHKMIMDWKDHHIDLVRNFNNYPLLEGIIDVDLESYDRDKKNHIDIYFNARDYPKIFIKVYVSVDEKLVFGMKFIWNAISMKVGTKVINTELMPEKTELIFENISSMVTIVACVSAYIANCEPLLIAEQTKRKTDAPIQQNKLPKSQIHDTVRKAQTRIYHLSEFKPKIEYQHHKESWFRRGYYRHYRNPDGSVKKKVWIAQTLCGPKKDKKPTPAVYKL